MILTCGPGTPAAIVDLTVDPTPVPTPPAAAESQEEDGSSSSSSSEEEPSSDDPDDFDDTVMEREEDSPNNNINEEEEVDPPAIRRPPSESSASSTSTSPKRTLSDRMKIPEEDSSAAAVAAAAAAIAAATNPLPQQPPPRQPHDMNLDTTSGDDGDEEEDNTKDSQNSKGGKQEEKALATEKDSGREMPGYSDVEKEFREKAEREQAGSRKVADGKKGRPIEKASEEEEEEKEGGGMHDEEREEEALLEELEQLTDRERFFLALSQAEENRMQFSSDESVDDDDDDDDSDNNEAGEGNPSQARIRQGVSTSTDEEDGVDEDGEDDEDDDDEEMADFREMAAEWFAMEEAEADDDDDEDDDDSDDGDDEDDAAARIIIRRRFLRRSPSPGRRSDRTNNSENAMKPSLRHGGCINTAAWMQAGWRLSTVSSHDCSSSYNANSFFQGDHLHAILSDDCPTQLVTSGDDRLVKFWDVRHAMGSCNPLPWGRNTHNPFAYTPEDEDDPGYRARWSEFYHKQKPVEPWQVFGNVIPLATLNTGHRANVFHVTPLWQQPGKVATCGADGYLRLGDVEASSGGDSNSSSIIISPEYFDDGADHMMRSLFSLRTSMAFSHHFLNSSVGLLCSQSGLRKFDIRLPPRQQERRAVLGGNNVCKACAVWTVASADSVEEVDSTYIFGEYIDALPLLNMCFYPCSYVSPKTLFLVGGTGADVALCDLRMTGGDSSENTRIVCQYRPKGLHENEDVSVSGLDLSRDKKELLVSYESDQIYTFPIFPNAKSAAGPTLEEIGGLEHNEGMDEDNEVAETNGCMSVLMNGRQRKVQTGEDVYFNELASYGGHLNRFTFLKNAKYAGPNDEYICTGSDSGHAWIYERATGAVVSLLNADNSTCNGVVPHPSLPFFITYGIDSTAKLWRATGPVDPNTDDSPSGREKAFQASPYEMSPLTKEWDTIEQEIANIEQELAEADAAREDDEDEEKEDSNEQRATLSQSYNILPDQVLNRKELINAGRFGARRFYTPGGAVCSKLGNDLQNLPEVVRKNQYECIRAAIGGGVGRRSDPPVESDLKELMRRISLIRLRHQADRQGLSGRWNPSLPWIMDASTVPDTATIKADDDGDNDDDDVSDSNNSTKQSAHPADLVPDNPSDWIPYDPEMSKGYRPCGMNFNCEDYDSFYGESYLHSDKRDLCGEQDGAGLQTGISWRRHESEVKNVSSSDSDNAYRILHETARVLKDGGNEALREGNLDVAARRYDKAIRYCSVAFMSHNAASTYGGKYEDELMLISMKMLELDIESEHTVTPLMLKWSPLLKVLVSTRLNLSMLLLKQAKHQKEMPQLQQAMDQARHALRELQPFCTQQGKICVSYMKSGSGGRLCTTGCLSSCSKSRVRTEVLKSQEPDDTFKEAKMLEAKAYFRLGSAYSDMGDYGEAVKSFDKSVECTLELNPDATLDPLVLRRLAEAKNEKIRQNKRQRKKFRMMFAQEEGNGKSKEPTTSSARGKENARRRTTAVPAVSPATPRLLEDRGTQSE